MLGYNLSVRYVSTMVSKNIFKVVFMLEMSYMFHEGSGLMQHWLDKRDCCYSICVGFVRFCKNPSI